MAGLIDLGQDYARQAMQGLGELSNLETNRNNSNRMLQAQQRQAMGQAVGQAAGLPASIAANYGLSQLFAPGADLSGVPMSQLGGGMAGEAFPGAGLAGEVGSVVPEAAPAAASATGPVTAPAATEAAATGSGLGTAALDAAYGIGDAAAAAYSGSWLSSLVGLLL